MVLYKRCLVIGDGLLGGPCLITLLNHHREGLTSWHDVTYHTPLLLLLQEKNPTKISQKRRIYSYVEQRCLNVAACYIVLPPSRPRGLREQFASGAHSLPICHYMGRCSGSGHCFSLFNCYEGVFQSTCGTLKIWALFMSLQMRTDPLKFVMGAQRWRRSMALFQS